MAAEKGKDPGMHITSPGTGASGTATSCPVPILFSTAGFFRYWKYKSAGSTTGAHASIATAGVSASSTASNATFFWRLWCRASVAILKCFAAGTAVIRRSSRLVGR